MPPHVDPDDLALLALGEHPPDVDESHLDGCGQCRSELDELRSVVSTARTVTAEDAPVPPPPRVWEAVSAELRLGQPDRPVVLADRRLPRRTMLLAAAAAVVGLVAGIGGTLLATRTSQQETVLMATRLTVLKTDQNGGSAEVVRAGAGRLLEVDLPTLRPANGYYEVWLLGSDGKRLLSVGLVDLAAGPHAAFPIPADVDMAKFPIVDVSLEPADGNPAHSGDSIVRGTLAS